MREIGIIANSAETFSIAQRVTKDYADMVEIVPISGYGACIQWARNAPGRGIRLLIARGGYSVHLRRANVPLPIVDMPILDSHQLACRMIEAKKQFGSFAVIGNTFLIERARELEEAIGPGIRFFEIQEWEDFKRFAVQARALGLKAVVGGYDALEFAREEGLTGFGIYTHEKEMYIAFDEALKMLRRMDEEQRQTKLLHTVLDSIHEGIVLVDQAGIVTHISHAANQLLGVDGQTILGMPIQDDALRRRLDQVLATGRPLEDELHETGHYKYTCSISPIRLEDRVAGAVIILQEVEYVRRMEHKIRKKLALNGLVATRTFEDILGASPPILEAVRRAKQYSLVNSTVLISGESGTGKELFAQSIHNHSLRREEAFVALNCATIPPNLLESELFGYVEGAFTGAKKGGKVGLFELAHNGTIFLDEIGEISINMQARLLRVLEEKQIIRIGDDKVIPVNIRVVAATNKNLETMVEEGDFRADFFYRLNVLSLELPPLRQRRQDIQLLIDRFLHIYADEHNRNPIRVTDEAMDILLDYSWPGNIRELKNVIERLVVTLEQPMAGRDEVITALGAAFTRDLALRGKTPEKDLGLIDLKEWEVIRRTLEETGGNKTEAARRLGISRPTLHRKLKEMGEMGQ